MSSSSSSETPASTPRDVLWANGVFSHESACEQRAVSVAGNEWQLGLVQGLLECGTSISIIGHLPESVWPRGSLLPDPGTAQLSAAAPGHLVKYWNLPLVRHANLLASYIRAYESHVVRHGPPRAVITYDAKFHSALFGLYCQNRYGIPWLCLVADTPTGKLSDVHEWALSRAKGCVFLPWSTYEHSPVRHKLHLDGGVANIHFDPETEEAIPPKHRLMYAGGLTEERGVNLLLDAFAQLKNADVELWVAGPGQNSALSRAAAADPRIQILGLLPDAQLKEKLAQADVFVNPRDPTDARSFGSFPSKVLLYLSYGKPVVSTWTLGLSPDYRDVLVIAEADGRAPLTEAFAGSIERVLNRTSEERRDYRRRVATFLGDTRLWRSQAQRLLSWLDTERLWRSAPQPSKA